MALWRPRRGGRGRRSLKATRDSGEDARRALERTAAASCCCARRLSGAEKEAQGLYDPAWGQARCAKMVSQWPRSSTRRPRRRRRRRPGPRGRRSATSTERLRPPSGLDAAGSAGTHIPAGARVAPALPRGVSHCSAGGEVAPPTARGGRRPGPHGSTSRRPRRPAPPTNLGGAAPSNAAPVE